jgi:hypothetical protein
MSQYVNQSHSSHQYVEGRGVHLIGYGMREWMKQWMYRNSQLKIKQTEAYGNLM